MDDSVNNINKRFLKTYKIFYILKIVLNLVSPAEVPLNEKYDRGYEY